VVHFEVPSEIKIIIVIVGIAGCPDKGGENTYDQDECG